MKASLEVLQDGVERKVAVLGDMGELGPEEEEELHRQVGEYAGTLALDLCVCTGPLCACLAEGIRSANPSMEVVCFPSAAGAAEAAAGASAGEGHGAGKGFPFYAF